MGGVALWSLRLHCAEFKGSIRSDKNTFLKCSFKSSKKPLDTSDDEYMILNRKIYNYFVF